MRGIALSASSLSISSHAHLSHASASSAGSKMYLSVKILPI